jgi:HEAT repeat protein
MRFIQMSKSAIVLLVAAAMALPLWGQVSPKAVRTADEMEPLLKSLSTYEFGQSREAQAQFTQLVQDSLANPALLKQIEAGLLAFLQSNATAAGKQFALRELGLIGTEASVPALAPMLLQPATSEMARFALGRIPGPVADQALRDALAKAAGNIRIGIIGSLGQRRDVKAVPALTTLSSSNDLPAAEAAIAALAEIADRPSLNALSAAHAKASGAMARRVSEAYLLCAGRLAAQDKETALKVYKELIAAKEPPLVRVAALNGLASLSPKEAVPALATEIQSADARVQFGAMKALGGIPGADVTAAMERAFPNLAPAGRVRLLGVLAERGDSAAQPLFARAVKDASPAVRTAALSGLGSLGDRSSVAVLAEAAATGQPAEQAAARQSLKSMRGDAIDPALVSAIGASTGKVKAELILAAGERGAAAAADAVVKAIQDPDPDVHREALRAARNVAGPRQVSALVDLVMNVSKPSDRRDAGQALASALQRSEPARIGAVIASYKTATALEPRLSLLESLGQTSHAEALALLRSSLADPAPDIVRGSILALSGWSNPAPLPDLLGIAKSHANPVFQTLALRGYLKLVGLPSERPNAESARLLGDAAALAKEVAEKRTLLSLLANYPCKESLQIAETMAKDPAVASEAKAAIDRINGAPGGRGRGVPR